MLGLGLGLGLGSGLGLGFVPIVVGPGFPGSFASGGEPVVVVGRTGVVTGSAGTLVVDDTGGSGAPPSILIVLVACCVSAVTGTCTVGSPDPLGMVQVLRPGISLVMVGSFEIQKSIKPDGGACAYATGVVRTVGGSSTYANGVCSSRGGPSLEVPSQS